MIKKSSKKFILSVLAAGAMIMVVIAIYRPGVLSPPIDLFIMAGQSNMQGWRGNAEEYPIDTQGIDRNIRFYWVTPGYSTSDGKWKSMQPQEHLYPKGHFGPEVTFARNLRKYGCNPAIFKFSLGGTSLAKDWRAPGNNGLYDKMVKELSRAIEQLEDAGYRVNIKAFVWIQGESDARSEEMVRGYGSRLRLLITNLRNTVFDKRRLPVILGVDEEHPRIKKYPGIVAHHMSFADSDPDTIFTSMRGLEKADKTHLTPSALEIHGDRLFEAFSKLGVCVEDAE